MSLLNHVLRDLDQRTGTGIGTGAALPVAVQATAAAKLPPRRRLAVLAGLGLVAAASLAAWRPSGIEARLAAAPEVALAPQVRAAVLPPPVVAAPSLPASASADAVVPVPLPHVVATTGHAPASPKVARHSRARATPVKSVKSVTLAAAHLRSPKPIPLSLPLPPEPSPDGSIEMTAPASKPHDRADAAYRQGLAAHERGDVAAAAHAYAKALQDEAGLVPARVGLASVLIAQSRLGEAEAALQAGLALDPQQPLLAQPLARLMADRGDLAGAITLMQTALPGGAANADYRACLGALLQRAGREREAGQHFDAALRLQPGNGVWWMGLAMSLAAQGQGDAARTAYARARNSGQLSAELVHFVELRMRDPI